ncbi:MAG: transporter substrate-binding domain-containing protein [Azospirillaceae bacterium]|nr:transporter substrate-binding domain-containing protein [Azospirillaceae bacterium]
MMRTTHAFSAFALVTVVVSSTAPSAHADETYIVGVENIEYYPQYNFKDGEYSGFARVLLDDFAHENHYVFTYSAYPVARLFNEFMDGTVDLKYPDNALWSSELTKGHNVVYSDPVVNYTDGVSILPDHKGRPVSELKQLGIVRGFTAWEYADQIKNGTIKLQENNSFVGLLEVTQLGRVDGAYGNVAVVNYTLKNNLKKPDALIYNPSLPHTTDAYHLSSIKHPKVIAEFNAWLKQNADKVAKLKADYAVEAGVP